MTVEKSETPVNRFLNATALNALATATFQQREPYPWINIPNILTSQGFEQLRTTLPDVDQFERRVAVKRAFGQGYHDRYILHYRAGVEVSPAWRQFVKEINGPIYDAFIRRMFGIKPRAKLILTMEWYFGWQGCGVSPHCDARRKLGTHIFYFNTDADWRAEWGGEILLMDDQKKWKAHSARNSTIFRLPSRSIRAGTTACSSSGPSTRGTACVRWRRRPTSCGSCSS